VFFDANQEANKANLVASAGATSITLKMTRERASVEASMFRGEIRQVDERSNGL
jgi:hypothetical protein